jgi:hypothetical protein
VGLSVLYFLDNIEAIREDTERRISEVGGWHNPHERFALHCVHSRNNQKEENTCTMKINDKKDPK